MNGFGAVLKALREMSNLTQKELAEKAGLSQRAVSHWEQGLREPGWQAVQALAAALGVSCEAFQVEAPASSPAKRGRPGKGKKNG